MTSERVELRKAAEIEGERREFKADRGGPGGRVTYIAHGRGYVMIRRPGCVPFVVTEDDWRSRPLWNKPPAHA